MTSAVLRASAWARGAALALALYSAVCRASVDEEGGQQAVPLEITNPAQWQDEMRRRVLEPLQRQEMGAARRCKLPCPAETRNPSGAPASFGNVQMVMKTLLDSNLAQGIACGPQRSIELSPESVQELSNLAAAVFDLVSHANSFGDADTFRTTFIRTTGLLTPDSDRVLATHALIRALEGSGVTFYREEDRNAKPPAAYTDLENALGTGPLRSLLEAAGFNKRESFFPYVRNKMWNEAWHGFVTLTLFEGIADSTLGMARRGTKDFFLRFFTDPDCNAQVEDKLLRDNVRTNYGRWGPERIRPPLLATHKGRFVRSFAGLTAFKHNIGKVWEPQRGEQRHPFAPRCRPQQFAHSLFGIRYVASFLGHWDKVHRDMEQPCD